MKIMCDNTASIVLATGEGSWRTKSAANKVHAVREKVDCGMPKIEYVSTSENCADSLTKFLKGGQDQAKANLHLSLVNLENWLPKAQSIKPVKEAKGVRFSKEVEFHRPRISCVIVSNPEVSEVSGVPADFGPVQSAQRKNV